MSTQEFVDKLGADQALAEKMSKATSPEIAYAIAKEAGVTDSFEDFAAAMKKINDTSGEMTTAEINAVTGGTDVTDVVDDVVVSFHEIVYGVSSAAI